MFDENLFIEKMDDCYRKKFSIYNFKNYNKSYTIFMEESKIENEAVDMVLLRDSKSNPEILMQFHRISYIDTFEHDKIIDIIRKELHDDLDLESLISEMGNGDISFAKTNSIIKGRER